MFENYGDILSVEEVAKALSVSRNRIYALLQSGELKGHREGHVWKVLKIALIDYCMKKGNLSSETYGNYR